MKIKIEGRSMVLTREKSDKRPSSDSHLLYTLKKVLNLKPGYDLVKVRMWKDGHLTNDTQQYLRSRRLTPGTEHVMIYHERYMVENAAKEFWSRGSVMLKIVRKWLPARKHGAGPQHKS